MSTIKIEFESEDNAVVTAVAALTNSLLGKSQNVNDTKVVEAEEVKTEAPKRRSSPAKKPEPVAEEPIEEEEEDLLGANAEEEEETISEEDLKAMLGKKVTLNRDAIVKKLKELGSTKLSDLPKEYYQTLYYFMAKLK